MILGKSNTYNQHTLFNEIYDSVRKSTRPEMNDKLFDLIDDLVFVPLVVIVRLTHNDENIKS